jgi:hypothetical protein
MIAYRIYTERKNVDGIKEILDDGFDGYTLIFAAGVWEGETESSLIIEIIGETKQSYTIHCVAKEIAHLNNQDAVLITQAVVEGELIRIAK